MGGCSRQVLLGCYGVAAVDRFYWDAMGNRWVAAVDRFYGMLWGIDG